MDRYRRELVKITFWFVAMAILAAIIIRLEGEEGVQQLKRWGTIFGGFILVGGSAIGIIAYFAYRQRKSSERREAERLARMTYWPEETVRSFVRDVLPTGLLESLEGLNEDEAVRKAIDMIGKHYDPEKKRDAQAFEDFLLIAHLDSDAFSWFDLECDVCDANGCYKKWFSELSRISHGAFQPTTVEETWETAEGPICVEFTLMHERRSVSPKYIDDWLDLSVLDVLNDLICDLGRQFEVLTRTDQTACVICLTPEQKAALMRRDWTFESRFETHPEAV